MSPLAQFFFCQGLGLDINFLKLLVCQTWSYILDSGGQVKEMDIFPVGMAGAVFYIISTIFPFSVASVSDCQHNQCTIANAEPSYQ